MPQVIATPHIAASTTEAQELVGVEVAMSVRDYLSEGLIRNAVNFPAIAPDDFPKLRPYLKLAEMLGAMSAQSLRARAESIGVRYYGPLTTAHEQVLGSAVLTGALSAYMDGVTPINARALASQRGLDVVESRSTRARDFVNVISVKLRGGDRERWVEGTVFEPSSPRLSLLDGVAVEAPLGGGTLVLLSNEDRPGVIGEVGSAMGRHGVNIGSFALGRSEGGAVGVISVDAAPGVDAALEEIRNLTAIREAVAVRL